MSATHVVSYTHNHVLIPHALAQCTIIVGKYKQSFRGICCLPTSAKEFVTCRVNDYDLNLIMMMTLDGFQEGVPVMSAKRNVAI